MSNGKPKQNKRRLYELAEAQGGFFTANQAESLGYRANIRNYHVSTGNWIREARGIYRLALFPRHERPDLLMWWLWSRDRSGHPQCVYSHRTALSLLDLTDLMPAKIEMTVPKTFRRGAPIPRILRLYYDNIPQNEIERINGVPVTGALRTILDLWQSEEISRDILRNALKEGTRLGRISSKQIQAALKSRKWGQAMAEIAEGNSD